ncbi:MAG: hypothetical protein LC745_13315 [Planctomycetia bacterium]|nr:hypothetical protein [Planctomycetia bacterium]
MANAQVEKIKALGMRHGEKAVVGLTAALCLLCLFRAATKPSIEMTPDQVNKDAQAAQSSLSRTQPTADILTAIESQGVKTPEFAKLVEEQEKNALNPTDFKVARSWVTPEPGAGLIRDTPELLAPTNLYAYPGRGGASVYELVDGKRVPEDPATKKDNEADTARRGKKRRRGMSSMEMMRRGPTSRRRPINRPPRRGRSRK